MLIFQQLAAEIFNKFHLSWNNTYIPIMKGIFEMEIVYLLKISLTFNFQMVTSNGDTILKFVPSVKFDKRYIICTFNQIVIKIKEFKI